MATLELKHAVEMHGVLKAMLQLRRCGSAWRFLLHGNAVEDARLLVSAKLHHISGSMKTNCSELTDAKPNEWNEAISALELLSKKPITLNTAWYYVPHRSFGHVSVGAVVGENDDQQTILFSSKISNRYTRYARNDVTGDFVSLTFDNQHKSAEVLFIAPVSTTERRRVFIRFDYDAFMDACAQSRADDVADVERLFRAIRISNLVREYRDCSVCHSRPGGCACMLPLTCPSSEFDLEHNARNMLEQVGCFVGFSYHQIKFPDGSQYLGEFITECNMNGGLARADESRRLLNWAIQNRLHDCPMNLALLQAPAHAVHSVSRAIEVGSNDLGNSFAFDDDLLVPFVDDPSVSTEADDLQVPTLDLLHNSPMSSTSPLATIPQVTPLMTATTSPVAFLPSMIQPSPLPLHVGMMAKTSMQAPPIEKKRRGRRPSVKPVKPSTLVKIAPAAGSEPLQEGKFHGFNTLEEWKTHQKTIRSRISAQKSNAKRKARRDQQREEQRRAQANSQTQLVL